MNGKSRWQTKAWRCVAMSGFMILVMTVGAFGHDLDEIKKEGVLRHLGVPYANFVTGSGDGMDVELIQLFARHIGVRYEYVKTSWANVVPDLVGKNVKPRGDGIEIIADAPVRGDVVASGFTILPWREKILNFSTPTFPTQIILVAGAKSSLKPIKPSGNVARDIERVKGWTRNRTILGVEKTCLDPSLYGIHEAGAKVRNFTGEIDDIAAAVVQGEAETAIMEMPDALLALKKYPGKIKIIGPLSPIQKMAAGFAKDAPLLLAEFNKFLAQSKKDGAYRQLVKKYYPSALGLYGAFFN